MLNFRVREVAGGWEWLEGESWRGGGISYAVFVFYGDEFDSYEGGFAAVGWEAEGGEGAEGAADGVYVQEPWSGHCCGVAMVCSLGFCLFRRLVLKGW